MAIEAQARTEADAPRVGAMLKHYELVRKLGEGGMGTVYLARDTELGRLVAIKVVASGSERFRLEAQATARCRHDNIVVIHEVDQLPGHLYMVLEYLEGRTLREWMGERERAGDARVSPSLAAELVIPVVRALACAHQLGIVHRDLKPENIFLTDAGRVVVLDFGIAKRLDAAELSALDRGSRPGARLTQDGALLGTLPYMSPEQLRADDVDPRSDLWTVGIVLFELVAGAHPLAHCSVLDLLDVGESDAPMPRIADHRPDVGALGPIIDRCLAKSRAARPGSAAELLAALERLSAPGTLGEEDGPFAGLAAFQEADAERYVGRAREVAGLTALLRNQPLVVVAGPSGAGKSSFVRAGVIPALKRSGEPWDAVILRPGRRPVAQLADAIGLDPEALIAQPGLAGARLRERCRDARGPRRIVVFVDQLEELYTLGASAAARAAFVACLEGIADDASSPLRVVLSLRSDFLDRLAADGHFLAETPRGLWLLRPMARDGLREALIRPLESVGYRFESDALIDEMLDGLAPTKSPLPLLQFTAARLWDARDREARCLTQASYDASGGVAGALSAHANAVLAGLPAADQAVCRAVVLRLCTPERTRAVVGLGELAALGSAAERVCRRLADARLVVIEASASGATVELCHEALIERWDKLAHWLAEGQLDRQLEVRLETAARQWEAGHRAEGLLWRDRPAAEAVEWLARRRAPLPAREQRFLAAVIALARRRRSRRRRIIALLVTAVGVAVALAIALGANVRDQARAAETEARLARNAARMAAARELEVKDPTAMAVLLRELEPPGVPRGWSELASKALQSPLAREVRAWDAMVFAAAWSPDGRRAAVGLGDGSLRIWTIGDPAEPRILRGHDQGIEALAWSPDGARVATASIDQTARIWRVDGASPPVILRGHHDEVYAVAFSADGTRVVTGANDRTARIWNADGSGPATVLGGHEQAVTAVGFAPDGTRVVTGCSDGMVRVWRADGTLALALRGHEARVLSAAFSPDGTRLATSSHDGTVRVWRADGAGPARVLRGHDGPVRSVAWSADGSRLATGGADQTARVWTLDDSADPVALRGHTGWVVSASWSPRGDAVLTASNDQTTRVFALAGATAHAPLLLRGHDASVMTTRWSRDGQQLISGSLDGIARVWDLRSHSVVVLRGHAGPIVDVTLDRGRTHAATASDDRTARVWRTDGAGDPVVLRDHAGAVHTIDVSPDGQHVVTTSDDRTARIEQSDGGGAPVVLRHPASVLWANYSPDGRFVFTGAEDHALRVWRADGAGAQLVRRSDGPIRLAEWSPDSSRVVVEGPGTTALVWRTDGRVVAVLQGHAGPVSSATWSRDGARIATASYDSTARVARADGTGAPVVLRGHASALSSVAFTPDGARVITSSLDETVRVWRADGAGEPYVLFPDREVRVYNAVVSPDGTRVATTAGARILIYPLDAPFTGLDDPRLQRATPYCLTVERRVQLLGISEARARQDQAACEARVATDR
jgi:WD40 repeat protein/predicted Ser/Thr protein kinase